MDTATVETTAAMGIMDPLGTGHSCVKTTGVDTIFTTGDIGGMTEIVGMTPGAIGIDSEGISVKGLRDADPRGRDRRVE